MIYSNIKTPSSVNSPAKRDRRRNAGKSQNEMFYAAPNPVVVDAKKSAGNNFIKRSWVNS